MRRWIIALPLGFSALFGNPLSAQAATAAPGPDPTWLEWNATTRTAKFKLVAGIPGRAKSPFNFNGYTDGELTLVVPLGSTVVMNFVNDDGTPHSAQIINSGGTMPNMAIDVAAIPRAYSKQAGEGIGQFGTDILRFTAAPAGDYLIFCGVPGHGLSGMWIRFAVSPTAQAPALIETPKSARGAGR
ncbi:MAG: sulfocyanin-like copper-binding protein [Gemmatimonadota bacterium]|nr:sulfocyanin-like copper-binding protein [Gemmatimonadota bacterium]